MNKKLLVLAVVASLFASACDSSEDRDGRYSSLLRLVPDQPAFRDGVTIVDYEAIRALPGYEQPVSPSATDDDRANELQALADALRRSDVPVLFREILGSDWESLPRNLANWEQGFGFGLDDIDLALTAGVIPPRKLYAIGGQFDPEAIQRQLKACGDCLAGEQREHRGQQYLTWGEGQTLPERLRLPAVDDLGRGGTFVFESNYILRSNFLEEFEASIDASQGRASLLGDRGLASLATELDSLDLLALFVSGRSLGPDYAASLIERVGGGDAASDERVSAAWDVPADEKLAPYQSFAVGVGVADGEPYTVVMLVHESSDAAAANALRLEDRIETGLTVNDGETWANSIDSSDVEVSGRLVTATLRGRSYFSGLANTPGLTIIEALLAHE